MKNRTTPDRITELKPDEVFVFGSNERGIHGAGAANTARRWGARMGEGHGHQGQTYALATVSVPGRKLPMPRLKQNVDMFISYAFYNPAQTFLVTEVGCGLAGFTAEEIAPLFKEAVAIDNIHLPARFWEVLNSTP